MATEKQIEANRNNAKKSTGPRTDEGKAQSACNSLKHGLLARDAVLPGEDPAEYDQQFRVLEHAIQPDNALEFEFVRQMADAQWRMRRLVRLETGFLSAALREARGVNATPATNDHSPNPYEADTLALGQAMLHRTHSLLSLARYDAQLSRRFHRAFDKLIEFRHAQRRAREHYENHGPDPGERHWSNGSSLDFYGPSDQVGLWATKPLTPPPPEPSSAPLPGPTPRPAQTAPRARDTGKGERRRGPGELNRRRRASLPPSIT